MVLGILIIIVGGILFAGGIWMIFCGFGESFDVSFRILSFISWSGNVTFIILGILLAIFGVAIAILGIQTIRERTKGGDAVSAELRIQRKDFQVFTDAKEASHEKVVHVNLYNDHTAVCARCNGEYLGRIDDATEILKFVKRNRIESAFISKDEDYRSIQDSEYRVKVYILLK